ncbi:PD-(D/E)XK nuclease family protein [Ruminococcus sp.]|uniref:PD-(D/E)XK nuclease family protein n=1 Tax=Ruminococcus sp. TaxID=41978 RepID=UPI0025EC1E03|nr:PD-(D/E)XK nuclease family protein [Ruminococcus sp.]MBQ6252706.1 exodeoxyribonuclease V subunit gamma [Ruminococcus sp.]MBR0511788.1 exodeoxyribonuclease V subunit gamma [Ruminococcus sp.]
MVEFITGPAGSGKTTCMFGRIKENCREADKLCIIVPEQFSQDFDKKLYFYLGAENFNELFSLSFTGLARQLFQLYGDPNRKGEYADDMAKMILVYQAVDAALSRPESLGSFRRQSTQSGFAEDIMTLIRDMKRIGIGPEELMNRSQLLDKRLMDKTKDVAAIFIEYQRLMEEYGFKDELDNIKEAAAVANLNSYFRGKKVFLDEFESFTADQYEMIKLIISSADNVCITLRTDDVNAGEYTLFETVNDTYRRIRAVCRELGRDTVITVCDKSYRFRTPDLEYVSSRSLRNIPNEPGRAPKAENIHIFEARDMYSEAEYVCAAVKHLLYENSDLKYRDIAILSNDIAMYSDVLKAAFKRYDIPYFLSLEKSVAHTAVMVYFTTLLDILSSRKFRSEQIFRLVKSGLLDIDLTETALLENYCYKWGVDGDLWKDKFTADDPNLERLEKTRTRIIPPIAALKKRIRRNISASEICSLLYDHIVSCGAERNTARLMGELIKQNKDYEAAELKRLWGCLIDILDSISDTLGDRKIGFAEISRMIMSMIARIQYSVPPQTLDAVTAASARMARLDSPKIVFVMGVNDGDFPNRISLHGLFSEADRAKLTENGIELSTPLAELIASERLVVYKAISAASHKLFITYPLSDLSGQAKYPAQIVDRIIGMFGDMSIRKKDDDIPVDYYAVTLHSAFYHYMQERSSDNTSVASIKQLLMESGEYRRRLSYVISRSSLKQDYHIDSSVIEKLQSFDPLRLSSTGLEEYNQCHFKYFCDKCLRLHLNEKVELDARIAGELTHECFYGILGSRSKEEFISMTYDEVKSEINSCAEKYRETALAGDFGKDAKFTLIFNKLTERMSDVFLYTQQSLMASDFTPHDFELDLRDSHSVVLPFGSGRSLSFGGIVDRADVCRIGDNDYLRIIDYKSSRKDITPETLACGINMQMLLYLFASTDKDGLYEGFEPAGVLYSPVRISDVHLESHKVGSKNSGAVKESLRTSGLVLGDMDILRAMEKDVRGEFIPVKLDKNGVPDKRSSCISAEGMTQLRNYTYGKLVEMAESLLAGNAEAVPLVLDGKIPCNYCDYINICDNSELLSRRVPDEAQVAEAAGILGRKYEEEEE